MNEMQKEEYEALKIKLNDIRNEIYSIDNFLINLRSYMNDAVLINDLIFGESTFALIKEGYDKIGDNITYTIIPKINSDIETM